MDKNTIEGIRDYYKLPDSVTDEQIESDLKGSLGEALVNIGNAAQGFKKALIESVPEVFNKYFKR